MAGDFQRVSRYPNHDALVAYDNLIAVNGEVRRRLELELATDQSGLELNRLSSALPFDLRQDLEEGLGRDLFLRAANELRACETFMGQLS